MAQTFFEKVWEPHLIDRRDSGEDLIFCDRHYVHDLSGAEALEVLHRRGVPVARPDLTFGSPDHTVPSLRPRGTASLAGTTVRLTTYRAEVMRQNIRSFDLDHPDQGIIHVTMPELGLTLPGAIVLCGDSHTCTHGAIGAVAWGIGVSDVTQVLASQSLWVKRPKTLQIWIDGVWPRGVSAKDLVLALLSRFGTQIGVGAALEFAGPMVEQLSIEGRLTLCNMAIELGARQGFIAPDERTLEWVKGRPYAPKGEQWDQACAEWIQLRSDAGARYDRVERFDGSELRPQISWGTSPDQTSAVDGMVPLPSDFAHESDRSRLERACAYMGIAPGQRLRGLPVDRVFIGACTNSRLSDLQAAAEVVKGCHVAQGVQAWVVPGSRSVANAAEAMGLDEIFRSAGFEWREPGCSMCVGANGDIGRPGERVISTSNRNFTGRQGPGVRTHLASPRTAAASAIAGAISFAD
ncbi:MAG: 3-isopropylmalate dehydratase large subunit [Burkholderiaceae bacterium]